MKNPVAVILILIWTMVLVPPPLAAQKADFQKLQKKMMQQSKKDIKEKRKKERAAKKAKELELKKLYAREIDRLSEMVLAPAGEFAMGSNAGSENERPVHTVHLNAFYIDKYEVTQIQYREVMLANPSHFKDCPLCPVDTVSWQDAWKYCSRLHKRLPTEAEWEKAARAGSASAFYWGDDMDDAYAWHLNNSSRKTHPVGQKKPNGYGLYDMAGNVYEWVADRYEKGFYSKSPAGMNPSGPLKAFAKREARVLRGGSWINKPFKLRSAARHWNWGETRNNTRGFRCAHSASKN